MQGPGFTCIQQRHWQLSNPLTLLALWLGRGPVSVSVGLLLASRLEQCFEKRTEKGLGLIFGRLGVAGSAAVPRRSRCLVMATPLDWVGTFVKDVGISLR